MLINCILLALCVSIDSLGIGITYGLKNTKILFSAKFILFICSSIITCIAILIGSTLSGIFPNYITNFIGCILLCFMGFFIVFQSLIKDNKIINDKSNNNMNLNKQSEKVYQFFIKFLGITIQIIRNPNYSDLDNSNIIDSKEALYLGIALSLDSFGVGIGSGVLGLNFIIFPIIVSLFQLIFLSLGSFWGKKIRNISKMPENIWSLLSGFLLILIGLSKFIF